MPYRAGDGDFTLPDRQPADSFALDGPWRIETQYATPRGSDGRIRLDFRAGEVRVVAAGEGRLRVAGDGAAEDEVLVSGTPRSYALVGPGEPHTGILEVVVPEGVEIYSFTFG